MLLALTRGHFFSAFLSHSMIFLRNQKKKKSFPLFQGIAPGVVFFILPLIFPHKTNILLLACPLAAPFIPILLFQSSTEHLCLLV